MQHHLHFPLESTAYLTLGGVVKRICNYCAQYSCTVMYTVHIIVHNTLQCNSYIALFSNTAQKTGELKKESPDLAFKLPKLKAIFGSFFNI